uniref:Uncharacterized protein n=1 Tax=Setaria digitata TaxID=48799 RepID=A0A915Q1P5_9BILA
MVPKLGRFESQASSSWMTGSSINPIMMDSTGTNLLDAPTYLLMARHHFPLALSSSQHPSANQSNLTFWLRYPFCSFPDEQEWHLFDIGVSKN